MFNNGIAHSVAIFALVIAIGVALGRLKICGISLGITWVLFVGIIFAHFGMTVEGGVLHFMKEFGLILFVYSIGLQVGPGFFSSLKKEGLKLNMIAMALVFTGSLTALAIHFITGTPMSTMVGILYGAVTNTPGLGAAQQTYSDIRGVADESIALGYAVAYPLGVLGIIGSFILIKALFRIDSKTEQSKLSGDEGKYNAHRISVLLTNPNLFGEKIGDISAKFAANYVISRICRKNGEYEGATPDTVLMEGDRLRIVVDDQNEKSVIMFFGQKVEIEWTKSESVLEAKRIMITNPKVVGKELSKLGVYGGYSFNITRVNRAGIDLVARPNFRLQFGDRITIVGMPDAIANIEKILGNSLLRLRYPNLVPLFIGLFLGMVVGSIPFTFPFVPQSVKLGLAGGPLVVAILIARYGSYFKLAPYMTVSSNLMIREIGISLFLAGVGLGAGGNFVDTILKGDGLYWIGYGAIITIAPALLVGICARLFGKLDYYTIIGTLSGALTNPPALAYSNSVSPCDRPSVAYSTVYPLTMFMRVLVAQMLIIFFA